MFSYRRLVARKNELGTDVTERLENKAAVGQLGMWKGEDIFVSFDIAEVEDVEVENARGISL